MIKLNTVLAELNVVTSGSSTSIDFYADYTDVPSTGGGSPEFGVVSGNITAAGTTLVVNSPASGFTRQINYISVTNNDTPSADVYFEYNDGTTPAKITATYTVVQFGSLEYNTNTNWQLNPEGGSSGPPALTEEQIGFGSPSNILTSSADLQWIPSTNTLQLSSSGNSTIINGASGGAGLNLDIKSADGSSGNGGNLNLTSGVGSTCGNVNINGSDNATGGDPGRVNITAGSATSGFTNGARLALKAGDCSSSAGNGGQLRLAGGDCSSTLGGDGGSVAIFGGQGPASGTGQGGNFTAAAGSGFGAAGGNVTFFAGRDDTGSAGYIRFISGPTVSGTPGYITFETNEIERFRIDPTGTWLLATLSGTTGDVLTSQGAGTPPIWAAPSGAPGGSDTQIQFNNAGVFGGTTSTWDGTTLTLNGGNVGSGDGGDVLINGGSSGDANGGDVIIHSGPGDILNGSVEISTGGSFPQAPGCVGILASVDTIHSSVGKHTIQTNVTDRVIVDAAGEVNLVTEGKGLSIKEGTNGRLGLATLVGGTVTVNNTSVTANSRIFLTPQTLSGIALPAAVGITARNPGTDFTITSSDVADTSDIAYHIIEPI